MAWTDPTHRTTRLLVCAGNGDGPQMNKTDEKTDKAILIYLR